MATQKQQHRDTTIAQGIHTAIAWDFADPDAMAAVSLTSADVGKLARCKAPSDGPYMLYVVLANGFRLVGLEGPDYDTRAIGSPDPGSGPYFAHDNHSHALATWRLDYGQTLGDLTGEVTTADVGKVARLDGGEAGISFWLLVSFAGPNPVWSELTLRFGSSTQPVGTDATATEGTTGLAADAGHIHSAEHLLPKLVQLATVPSARALVASDLSLLLQLDSPTDAALTLPNDLPLGFQCSVVQLGAGIWTLTPGAGAALLPTATVRTAAYSVLSLVKLSTTWLAIGEPG